MRRTSDEIREQATRILAHVSKSGPKRAEELAEFFGVDTRSLERPIKLALREKMLAKEGQKRWTIYRQPVTKDNVRATGKGPTKRKA